MRLSVLLSLFKVFLFIKAILKVQKFADFHGVVRTRMKVSQVTAVVAPVSVLSWKVSQKKQSSFRTKGEFTLRLK